MPQSIYMRIEKRDKQMILSVSRRTDIPNYYSEWFYNRIKEGFVYVRNPMNPHQVSRIELSPETIDCIVFWTKNSEPMMERLQELKDYPYYFQFTLTGYGQDIEPNVPHKKHTMIPVFQRLSEEIGREKVIWRYDPILFTKKYTMEYHLSAFEQIAIALCGYTEKCVISFVDIYVKNQKKLQRLGLEEKSRTQLQEFAQKISKIAVDNHIKVATCAEEIDLTECGIEHNCCIDKDRIERIIGCKIKAEKDKNQRNVCGCIESVEIGTYHTCQNGCKYCYANDSEARVIDNNKRYDVNSPLLCGVVTAQDKITERKAKSLKERQYDLTDL